MGDMHLDNHTISKYVDGALTESERSRVERHIGECGACAAIVGDVTRIAGTVADSEDAGAGDVARTAYVSVDPDERTRRAAEALVGGDTIVRLPRAGWVAAALVVVAIGIGALVAGDSVWSDLSDPDTRRFRGTESVTDFALVAPADGDTIVGGPRLFRAAARPGALRYRFHVTDLKGSPVWSGSSDSPALEVDTAVWQGSGSYLWSVVALMSDGRQDESEVRVFVVSE